MTRHPWRVLVVLPTFNERQSLPALLDEILRDVPDVDVLVVDDHSPDGTGTWAALFALQECRVHVLHRPCKSGLGSAYKQGFAWGLARGYDALVEMDADGSHRPCALPALLDLVGSGADLAIGSRWVAGGGTVGWPLSRRLLSRTSNTIAEWVLHMGVADATAGFRVYSAEVVRAIDLASIEADGYAFQIEALFRVWSLGGRIEECPITFQDRVCGASKIGRAEVLGAMATLGRLWLAKRRERLGRPPRRSSWMARLATMATPSRSRSPEKRAVTGGSR